MRELKPEAQAKAGTTDPSLALEASTVHDVPVSSDIELSGLEPTSAEQLRNGFAAVSDGHWARAVEELLAWVDTKRGVDRCVEVWNRDRLLENALAQLIGLAMSAAMTQTAAR